MGQGPRDGWEEDGDPAEDSQGRTSAESVDVHPEKPKAGSNEVFLPLPAHRICGNDGDGPFLDESSQRSSKDGAAAETREAFISDSSFRPRVFNSELPYEDEDKDDYGQYGRWGRKLVLSCVQSFVHRVAASCFAPS
eukprot:3568758-Rhodomonas_salina.2